MSQLVCVMSDLLSVATEQLAFLYLDTGVRFHFRLSPDSEVVTITKCILFLNFTEPVKLISIFYILQFSAQISLIHISISC